MREEKRVGWNEGGLLQCWGGKSLALHAREQMAEKGTEREYIRICFEGGIIGIVQGVCIYQFRIIVVCVLIGGCVNQFWGYE